MHWSSTWHHLREKRWRTRRQPAGTVTYMSNFAFLFSARLLGRRTKFSVCAWNFFCIDVCGVRMSQDSFEHGKKPSFIELLNEFRCRKQMFLVCFGATDSRRWFCMLTQSSLLSTEVGHCKKKKKKDRRLTFSLEMMFSKVESDELHFVQQNRSMFACADILEKNWVKVHCSGREGLKPYLLLCFGPRKSRFNEMGFFFLSVSVCIFIGPAHCPTLCPLWQIQAYLLPKWMRGKNKQL